MFGLSCDRNLHGSWRVHRVVCTRSGYSSGFCSRPIWRHQLDGTNDWTRSSIGYDFIQEKVCYSSWGNWWTGKGWLVPWPYHQRILDFGWSPWWTFGLRRYRSCMWKCCIFISCSCCKDTLSCRLFHQEGIIICYSP